MSGDYSYQKPDENDYFNTLIEYLKYKDEMELLTLLSGGKCSISESTNYSRPRWNALATGIYFYVPITNLKLVNDEIKEKLTEFCDIIMPKEVGFHVTYVEFSPIMGKKINNSIIDDLDNTLNGLSEGIARNILQRDLIEKVKEMSEVYMYLYVVENSIRLFIDNIGRNKLTIKVFLNN